jgi:hypothetical protein
MNLASAFTSAWKDLKSMATKVAAVLTKDAPAIQAVVKEASTVAVVVDPTIAPVVTSLDNMEEVVMGKVMAAATNTANASSLAQLFGEAWPSLQAIATTLENHPTVASVTAVLSAPPVALPGA